jgi:O-antigen/teichoic acid export membrane protein
VARLLQAPGLTLRQRLLSGGAWAFAGKVFTALAQLATTVLLARLLSPRDMGVYFLAFSLVTVGSMMGTVGVGQAGVRFVAQSIGLKQYGQIRRVVGMVVVVGVLGSSGVGLAYLLLGSALGREFFGAPALVAATGLVAGWIMVTSLQYLLADAFRGFHDIRLTFVFGGSVSGGGFLAGTMVIVGLSLALFLRGQATLSFVVAIATVSGLTSALLAGWALRRKITSLPQDDPHHQPVALGVLLRVAGPLLLTQLTVAALAQWDIWILGAFRSQEELAVYGAAARVVLLVAMPLQMTNVVVEPLIAEMYAQGRKQALQRAARTAGTLAGIPALLVVAGLILLGGPLLGLFYGEPYREGATILAILSLGQLVKVWTGPCQATLGMSGHQSILMIITVVFAAITIVAGLAVVTRYGATGVAVTAAGGVALQNLSAWLVARFTTGIWTHIWLTSLPQLLREAVKRNDQEHRA